MVATDPRLVAGRRRRSRRPGESGRLGHAEGVQPSASAGRLGSTERAPVQRRGVPRRVRAARQPVAGRRLGRLAARAPAPEDHPHDDHRDDQGRYRAERDVGLTVGFGVILGAERGGSHHPDLVKGDPMSIELDYTFRAMGSDVRLLIGDRLLSRSVLPLEAADRERSFVLHFSDRLSRFRSDSDLSALNNDPRARVSAPPLLRAAVSAGLWAAHRSGGLVDPTLVRALEQTGYDHSLDGVEPASLRDALAHAPPRRAARPDPAPGGRRSSSTIRPEPSPARRD